LTSVCRTGWGWKILWRQNFAKGALNGCFCSMSNNQASIPSPEMSPKPTEDLLPVPLVDNDSLRKSSGSSLPADFSGVETSAEDIPSSPASSDLPLDVSDVHYPWLKQDPKTRGASAFWFKHCSMVGFFHYSVQSFSFYFRIGSMHTIGLTGAWLVSLCFIIGLGFSPPDCWFPALSNISIMCTIKEPRKPPQSWSMLPLWGSHLSA
jgi:hypothetical protein